MRVRINFTVDIDVDDYREKMGVDLNQAVLRQDIQEQCRDFVLDTFRGHGLKISYLGQNNKYDPETRQTIHEEYVNAT